MFDPRREKLSPRQEVLIPTAVGIGIGIPATAAASLAGWSDDGVTGTGLVVMAVVLLGWIFLVLAPQSRDRDASSHD